MSKRGRPRTPTSVLQLRNSKRAKYNRTKQEPVPEYGVPHAPVWLDREAKAEWRRVTKQLDKMGVVAKIDRSALAVMCEAWSDYIRLHREVKKEGETFKTGSGYIAKNPKTSAMNDAFSRWYRLAGEFGLTASSRSNLKTAVGAGIVDAAEKTRKSKSRFFRLERADTA